MAPPRSPCVRICTMDPESGLCEGCGRTLAEIAGWLRMSEDERQAIMDALPDRLEKKRQAELKLPPWRPSHSGWRSR